MASVTNLKDFFLDVLKNITYAERKILKALSKQEKDLAGKVRSARISRRGFDETVDCQATLEAGLRASAQAIERYETAHCGTLVAWAKILGQSDIEKLFREPLTEDKKTDQLLAGVAMREINRRAFEAQKSREQDREKEFGHRHHAM